MRHVVLPTAHSDADLALAGELVTVLNAETLYVAWTHARGPGEPKVEATVIEADDTPRPSVGTVIGHGFAALLHGFATFLGAFLPVGRPPAANAGEPARTPVKL